MTTPFYQKALDRFTKTQQNQIKKGEEKYPEPFNPHSWTPEQLLNHALEETVDLTHYLVGLKDLLDEKDLQIKKLQRELDRMKQSEFLRTWKPKQVQQKSPFETEEIKKAFLHNHAYFDVDDQH